MAEEVIEKNISQCEAKDITTRTPSSKRMGVQVVFVGEGYMSVREI